ncbi:YIP1 family protein [Alphaproteobacteria bacterium KMM 3653]|uniref:YIP1 family protein n=1 Tax=Harenicola maris TaxID=2841044 RepID=A0AAP2CNH6_9RHOB|nr:YIP1 family protein [Harenicola maris]
MAITTNILRSFRHPRRVMRAILSEGRREDRAIAYLMAACFIVFVGQWPLAARQAHLDPSVPLEARLGAALLAWMFIMPLVLYALGALSHLVMRLIRGSGSFYGARMALFWTLLVVSPLLLLQGMVAGFVGPGVELNLVYILVTVVFFYHWTACLAEAEFGGEAAE